MAKIIPTRKYDFNKMKVGSVKRVTIPKADPIAGTRALTAAYAFARRRNAKVKAKAKRVVFAGRLSKSRQVMAIHRVQ